MKKFIQSESIEIVIFSFVDFLTSSDGEGRKSSTNTAESKASITDFSGSL